MPARTTRLGILLLERRDLPAPLGLLVPAYFSPSADAADWSQLTAAAPNVPLTAIMNPASGPGTQPDASYAAAVAQLQAAGGKVIGYLATDYAQVPLAQAFAQIRDYNKWYHPDGIFVDQMTSDTTPAHLTYYRAIDRFAHALHAGWTVVGNPGTDTPSNYLRAANTLVEFEDGSGYDSDTPPSYQAQTPAADFANLVYNVSTTSALQADVQLAASRNTGWIYVTDANLPNPYAALPSYWTDLVTAVAANNSGIVGGGLTTAFFVAPSGSDTNPGTFVLPFKTIQHALNVADQPGDTVEVRGGTYREKLSFPASGSASGGAVTLEAYPGETAILNGAGVPSSDVGFGNDMIQLVNVSDVTVRGFTIENDVGTARSDASGIHVEGAGSNISILANVIDNITGVHAMGISVYGSSLAMAISQLTIDGNTIFHCQPADSETLTLNGNVSNFQVTNNLVHDCNNIGIDLIGGEASIFGLSTPQTGLPVARDGLVQGNTVYHNHANYGGGFAAGIYVDGGQDITVAANVCDQNDLGLEVGAENAGYVASGIVVENNLIYANTKAGLVFGGFDAAVGRVENCRFLNNTLYENDTRRTGDGQLWIQFASNNLVTNNLIVAGPAGDLIGSFDADSNVNNVLDYNLYFTTAATPVFNWNGAAFNSLSALQAATGADAHSLFADPLLQDPGAGQFELTVGSPALGAGSSARGQFAATDFTGQQRGSPPSIGAYDFFGTSG